jgi:nucleotide-binding universal stress UspA family protein
MICKFLVALDGSPRARPVLFAAANLAEFLRATMDLLRVITIPPEFPAAAHATQGDPLPAFMEREAYDAMRVLLSSLPRIPMCQLRVRQGAQPWRPIIDVADEIEADLIVLGSHGYYAIDRLIGTTAARVANMARRNVLVIHNGEARARLGPSSS